VRALGERVDLDLELVAEVGTVDLTRLVLVVDDRRDRRRRLEPLEAPSASSEGTLGAEAAEHEAHSPERQQHQAGDALHTRAPQVGTNPRDQ
jgi:hypothetical protein